VRKTDSAGTGIAAPSASMTADMSWSAPWGERWPAAGGEVGAQPFLSPRTVEWHLRKVFMQTGVSSRRELVGALGGAGRSRVP
jgi:hypothetical protein